MKKANLKIAKIILVGTIVCFGVIVAITFLITSVTLQSLSPYAPIDKTSTPRATPPLAAPANNVSINSQILIDLLDALKPERFVPVEISQTWWVSNDGWNIRIFNPQTIGLIHNTAYSELETPSSKTRQVITLAIEYFNNNGFLKNTLSSSKNFNDESLYNYYLAYEKDKEQCVLVVNKDTSGKLGSSGESIPNPNITISCFDSILYQESYDSQIPFLRAMNDKKAGVYINKINTENSAAIAGVSWRSPGGTFALFVKQNGVWKMIYNGQDTPKCSVLQKYNFPEEIYSACY